ncbi:uncharacterized protein LOC134188094 [Corticium candelabrum]|uniref:uncharacterized protein LOC134188094 n=1 Tax=Corticium candelabrum TaxID=121492 RepID=UPI002E26175A|nr:uncharacterized protein LOC134188094 [Corticium candelabrum]XP_062512269.1 uncharacterized protein LOC134188094 [Corticium candelabrum]XP_062512270.1 uncharacterized protein LOC134188094 [Corticium candelabrum]XP_062512271.1 uncharacterized protein LOC134188094 [Corticium candelabrum]
MQYFVNDVDSYVDLCAQMKKAADNLNSDLQPDDVSARMCLIDLTHAIDRCSQTAKRAKRQSLRLVELASGLLFREAKRQLNAGSIDGRLVERLVNLADSRLSLVQVTVETLHETMNATAESIVQSPDVHKQESTGTKIAEAEPTSHLYRRDPVLSLSSSVIFTTIQCVLTKTGTSDAFAKKVDVVVTQLRGWFAKFQELYKNMVRAKTEINETLESTRTTTLSQPKPSSSYDYLKNVSAFIKDLDKLQNITVRT